MKKLNFLVFLFLFTLFVGRSQTYEPLCATIEDLDDACEHSGAVDPDLYLNGEPLVLNVFFWKVNSPDGSYNGDFTQDKLLSSIAELNIVYNEFNIFFKYRGYDEFDSPGDLPDRRYEYDPLLDDHVCNTYSGFDPDGYGFIDRCQATGVFGFASANGYVEPNAMNIYVPWGSNFGGVAQSLGASKLAVRLSGLSLPVMGHEMGHALGLAHTRSSQEHATRIEFLSNGDPNPDFNAKDKGDRVVDTAANSGFRIDGEYPFVDLDSCTYIGFETDPIGDRYDIYHEDIINTMADAYPCIESVFTAGQAIRMREKILCDNDLIPTLTDVASLYEPYTGEYYVIGPYIPGAYKPLIQPGFDLSFIDCSCNNSDSSDCSEPTDYNDTSFQNNHTVISNFSKYDVNYSNMTHPNHTAILIDQLDAHQPRRCYDNWNKAALGGSVTKFNDEVFNTNVTVTVKDSMAINNENLVLDLPEGLYKIEKNYDDGATKETIIIKENN